jgi:hypothetical protein
VNALSTPRKLGRQEAYALIAAEAQLLEEYRLQLQRELKNVDGRIHVLGAHYPADAEKRSLEMTATRG